MRSTPPAKQLDPAATRASILSAAARLFADRGFTGTSTADIAEAAGVTKSLVLYHYATKEALWREVIFERSRPIHESAGRFLEGDGDMEASTFLRAKFEANRNDPDLAKFLAWMSLEPGLATPEIREKAAKVREKMAADPARYGIPEGLDPMAFMVAVMSAVDGYFRFRSFYSVMVGCDLMTPEAEAAFFDVLMKMAFGPGPSPVQVS
ncbi:MAG: TetR/AcrR family transcriptional regulator [Fimbriimonadaceae bacterium]|nr:TetR/AcrR family transcriptional regulator [Fimbriimonadaceae bacterium]